MKENKVILVGGGSGGHIFPLIALSEELQARSIPFVFVGSDFGLEKQIVTSYICLLSAFNPESGVVILRGRASGRTSLISSGLSLAFSRR